MKPIKERLEDLERQARLSKNEVCVLGKSEAGEWRMIFGGKEHFYTTEAEAVADFERKTGSDSVLIIWDL